MILWLVQDIRKSNDSVAVCISKLHFVIIVIINVCTVFIRACTDQTDFVGVNLYTTILFNAIFID